MHRLVRVGQVSAVVGLVAAASVVSAALAHRGGGRSGPGPVSSSAAVVAAAGSVAGVDPCSLITQDEAQVALGAKPVQKGSATSCTYTVVDGGFRSLSAVLGPEGTDPTKFAAGMQQYAQTANADLVTVDGVGDEAYATFAGTADQLVARSGTDYVTVVLLNKSGTQADILDTLHSLGQTAVARI
jgi:hypothetical protein